MENKRILWTIGIGITLLLFVIALFSNPAFTGNIVNVIKAEKIKSTLRFIPVVFGFVLISGIAVSLLFFIRKKYKERSRRFIREEPNIQQLHSLGFKIKQPEVREVEQRKDIGNLNIRKHTAPDNKQDVLNQLKKVYRK